MAGPCLPRTFDCRYRAAEPVSPGPCGLGCAVVGVTSIKCQKSQMTSDGVSSHITLQERFPALKLLQSLGRFI